MLPDVFLMLQFLFSMKKAAVQGSSVSSIKVKTKLNPRKNIYISKYKWNCILKWSTTLSECVVISVSCKQNINEDYTAIYCTNTALILSLDSSLVSVSYVVSITIPISIKQGIKHKVACWCRKIINKCRNVAQYEAELLLSIQS